MGPYLVPQGIVLALPAISQFLFKIKIFLRFEHPLKMFSPRLSTDLGMMISLISVSLKALLPINSTPSSITTYLRDEHPSKALSAIVSTEEGM